MSDSTTYALMTPVCWVFVWAVRFMLTEPVGFCGGEVRIGAEVLILDDAAPTPGADEDEPALPVSPPERISFAFAILVMISAIPVTNCAAPAMPDVAPL